ncbi:MAG: phenylpyruvate tautomerase MIF-related protein [Lachnospiraceae bacterium]
MPCIQIKTNVKTGEQTADQIRKGLGKAISWFPGKSEDWLLVSIEDDCQMYFGGTGGRPIAMMEVKILGDHIDKDGAKHMTEDATVLLGEALGVAPNDMYIKYEALPDWGWNGKNF